MKAIAKRRIEEVRARKKVVSGVNDFADPQQTIQSLYMKNWKPVELEFGFFPLRRIAYEFESLRLSNESKMNKNKVLILTHGSLAKINARLNFIKNIFDTAVIPYEVKEYDKSITTNEYSRTILCAVDDDYQELLSHFNDINVCIAGKLNLQQENITEIFMGMNIFSFTQAIVEEVQS